MLMVRTDSGKPKRRSLFPRPTVEERLVSFVELAHEFGERPSQSEELSFKCGDPRAGLSEIALERGQARGFNGDRAAVQMTIAGWRSGDIEALSNGRWE